MSRYKRYERYKDSGVEWIGEIPEHWDVIKLKYVTKLAYGDSLTTENREEEGEVDVFGSNGKVGNHNVANTLSPVIIVGRKGSYGKVTYSDKECFAIDTTYYIDNRCTKSNIKWLYHSLMILELDKNSQDTGVPGLSREYAYNKYVPVPTVNEQAAIANFLDQKTAEIDDLIADKEKLIELMQEKRQAIITEAVTKGLNPNVRMKDSGIEWIGEIPEHWKVKKVKYLTSYIGSGKTPRGGSEVYTQEGVIFIRSQNVYPQGLRLNDVVFISEEIDSEMRNTRVKGNDILLNITGASIGRASLVSLNIPRANVNQHVCIIRPVKSKVLPSLLHQIICSNFIQNQIQFYQNGTSREGLNFEQIANLVVVIPNDLDEQRMLFEYIEDKVTEIDNLIDNVSYQIQKLKEYRQSLISEAVTGKIDVRDYDKN